MYNNVLRVQFNLLVQKFQAHLQMQYIEVLHCT
jgi:hypothetical protein